MLVIHTDAAQSGPIVELMPTETAVALWPTLLTILEEKGEDFLTVYAEEEVFAHLTRGTMDVWYGRNQGLVDGFVLCAWELHFRAKYYHVLGAFGSNLALYLRQGLTKIEQYAFGMGAVELIIEGRKGWQRMLRPLGYHPRTVKLRKNLRKAWGH